MGERGQLVEVLHLRPGDELLVEGQWLTITDVDRRQTGGIYLHAGGRTFLAGAGAQRRARRAATTAPTVST